MLRILVPVASTDIKAHICPFLIPKPSNQPFPTRFIVWKPVRGRHRFERRAKFNGSPVTLAASQMRAHLPAKLRSPAVTEIPAVCLACIDHATMSAATGDAKVAAVAANVA